MMVLDFGSKPDWQPNGVCYGRILNFAELRVEAWRPGRPYLLAEVHLYREQTESSIIHPHSTTRLPFFDLKEPFTFFDQEEVTFSRAGEQIRTTPPTYRRTAHCYVQVHHIAGMVAIAPKFLTKPTAASALHYYVLPLD